MKMREWIVASNPWWHDGKPPAEAQAKHRRALFAALAEQTFSTDYVRTPILLGPRRVGKTYLLRQIIGEAIASGRFKPKNVCFITIDPLPVRDHSCLYDILKIFREQAETKGPYLVVYDEIQSCDDWETQLKVLTDMYPDIRFMASGSAAYAMRLRGRETGVGRFSEYYLPPILFYEYLDFIGQRPAAFRDATKLEDILSVRLSPAAIAKLNRHLQDYLNRGGYPEMVFASSPSHRTITLDIFDNNLLRAIAPLYGKFEANDLGKVQGHLTAHSGLEINVSRLATAINVKRDKIADMLNYLVAAYVVARTPKVDELLRENANHRGDRYSLVNNSAYTLSQGVEIDLAEKGIGHKLEAFVRSQMHVERLTNRICYIHFKENNQTFEIDLALIDLHNKPKSLTEVKWDDDENKFLAADRTMAYMLNKIEWRKQERRPDILVCTSQSVYADKLAFKSGLTVIPTAQYGYGLGLEKIRHGR